MEKIQSEIDRGRAQCERDICDGVLQLFVQTRGAWGEFLTKLMLDRFGVSVVHTSDITTAAQSSFRMGYNTKTSEHIDSIHGGGSTAKAFAEMDAFRMERYRQHFPNG